MTIDEIIDGLKRIFSNYELNLPCTDSLNILSETVCLLEELKTKRKLLNFLFEVINPNDMEDYMRIYNATDTEKVEE